MTRDVQGGADEAAALVAAARRGPASLNAVTNAGIAIDAISKVRAWSRSFGHLDGRAEMTGARHRSGHVVMFG